MPISVTVFHEVRSLLCGDGAGGYRVGGGEMALPIVR